MDELGFVDKERCLALAIKLIKHKKAFYHVTSLVSMQFSHAEFLNITHVLYN